VDESREDVVMGRISGAGYVPPDPNGMTHESLSGAWHVAEYLPRRRYDWDTGGYHRKANVGKRRYIAPGSLVHESVFQRAGNYAARLPADVVRVP
jgi:hypothetical protein